MSTPFFRFRKFVVRQDRCAMKVGTDGTLLGAWAHGGEHVLDIGTGTGLIALMMAQRFPQAHVVAIDIDAEACGQAEENIASSPFSSRVSVSCQSLQAYAENADETAVFDAIVCNPPFFLHSLSSPDERRTTARHAGSLPHGELFSCVARLLSPEGEFSVIVPFDVRQSFDDEAALAGFFPSRVCGFSTSPRKPVRRYLLAYRKKPSEVEQCQLLIGSEEYERLLGDFYL
ncbi:MAG: methyltransferase [Prevotella sp.]|nr:methyltransferase [Prevotella sp.]